MTQFDWDAEEAKSLSILDIRNWRGHGDLESPEGGEPDSKVRERRTNLWKIVLAQELAPPDDDSWKTSFTIPLGSNSGPTSSTSLHVLRPDEGEIRSLPLQRIHISPHAIPSHIADICAETPEEMLMHLNYIFATNVPFSEDITEHFAKCVPPEWDVGTAYGYLRPWWHGFARGEYTFWEMDTFMGDRRTEDLNLRHRDALASTQWMRRDSFVYRRQGEGERIVKPDIPPRRVWDLYSNRVLAYSALPTSTIPQNLWAVSHSWVDASERVEVTTSINGFQWRVPIPRDTTLDRIRVELLNMGAEYVFLDVLCLRQWGNESLRRDEWELDVPTLGHVYRYDRYQTTIVYFNGLGRPFDLSRPLLDSPLHWLNRAWTLQETTINWLPGGLTSVSCDRWDGPYFIERIRESQRDLGLLQLCRPRFADLVSAMQRRPGYADKKPYDRVAALAYLLPGHQPEVYNERWKNAEEAWAALVKSLTGHERLDLLLYDMPDEETRTPRLNVKDPSPSITKQPRPWTSTVTKTLSILSRRLPSSWEPEMPISDDEEPSEDEMESSYKGDYMFDPWEAPTLSWWGNAHWRPSWKKVMANPAPFQAHRPAYNEDDLLRETIRVAYYARGRPAAIDRWYYHSAYVLEKCYAVPTGVRVLRPKKPNMMVEDTRPSEDSEWVTVPLQSDIPLHSEPNKALTLIGFAELECWVVGTIIGAMEIAETGERALEVQKIAVCRMADPDERASLLALELGRKRFVAYRDMSLLS